MLYHGSFAALARVTPGFDWREEAFETLTHELRHHLEWRARAPDLEELDWAVEQNYARQDGEAFDPAFFLAGAPVADDAWRVEDDVFLDRIVRAVPDVVPVRWAGREYLVPVPAEATAAGVSGPRGRSPIRPRASWCWCCAGSPACSPCSGPRRRYHAAVRVAEPSGYLPGTAPDGARRLSHLSSRDPPWCTRS